MYLKKIVQNCLINLNAERTIYSSYHILKGRKSVQTAQDVQVYNLTKYFKLLPDLTEEVFHQTIQKLIDERVIDLKDKKGWYKLNKTEKQELEIYLNGYAFSEVTKKFTSRLLLLVQALLNYQINTINYVPIIDELDARNYVKSYFKRRKKCLLVDKNDLHKEISQALEDVNPLHSYIYVQRFTGAKLIGKSIHQLADEFSISKINIQLILTSVTQKIISLSVAKPSQYPRLNDVISDLRYKPKLTKSAQQTYQYFKRNKDMEWIANQRRLKLSTIHDHIIEIALKDKLFIIDSFVSEEIKDKIIKVIKENQTYRLKEIKKHLPEEVSYFQIRLVLSTLNRSEDLGN